MRAVPVNHSLNPPPINKKMSLIHRRSELGPRGLLFMGVSYSWVPMPLFVPQPCLTPKCSQTVHFTQGGLLFIGGGFNIIAYAHSLPRQDIHCPQGSLPPSITPTTSAPPSASGSEACPKPPNKTPSIILEFCPFPITPSHSL